MAVKEVITKVCSCDLCDKSVNHEKDLTRLSIPVKFTTEQTEGRACEPYYIDKKLDLCLACRDRVVQVYGFGAQGYNTYRLM